MKVEAKQNEDTAVVPAQPAGAVAVTDQGLCSSGEWGEQGTLTVPQFTLVQPPMEELVALCPAGSFVYDKSEVLSEGLDQSPVPFTLLHAGLYWREKLASEDYDKGTMPRNFDTIEEALAAGLKKGEFKNNGPGTVSPASRSLVLVEVPEDAGIFEFAGRHFVKAMWFAHGVAFKPTSQIMTVVNQNKGLEGKPYKLNVSVSSVKGTRPTFVIPKLHKNGYHTSEFVEWVEKEVL